MSLEIRHHVARAVREWAAGQRIEEYGTGVGKDPDQGWNSNVEFWTTGGTISVVCFDDHTSVLGYDRGGSLVAAFGAYEHADPRFPDGMYHDISRLIPEAARVKPDDVGGVGAAREAGRATLQ